MAQFSKRFKNRLVRCYKDYLGSNLVALALFGSRARGTATPESDYDILIIAHRLPSSPLDRIRFLRQPIVGKFEEKIALKSYTCEEFEKGFPSLYLDLALDAIIFFDRNYLAPKLERIRQIIREAELKRKSLKGDFYWDWERPPKSRWEITWDGFREF